jgi:hypothetical protein
MMFPLIGEDATRGGEETSAGWVGLMENRQEQLTMGSPRILNWITFS